MLEGYIVCVVLVRERVYAIKELGPHPAKTKPICDPYVPSTQQ